MSSSRAMASAQQKRVTMQKSIVPVNNSNPRKSIASRGRFNTNPRRKQLLQQQQQQQQPQQQMIPQQQQMIPQQQQMIPQQQQMMSPQNDQFIQMLMQNNSNSNSNSNSNYSPMSFQSPSPVKSNKKIHINQVVSVLSQKIAHIERVMFGGNENEVNIPFTRQNDSELELDNSVLAAIIERIEHLEKHVSKYKELIDSNTKAIIELQCQNEEPEEEM